MNAKLYRNAAESPCLLIKLDRHAETESGPERSGPGTLLCNPAPSKVHGFSGRPQAPQQGSEGAPPAWLAVELTATE